MKDRIGEKYGRLTIVSFDKSIKRKPRGFRYYYNCICDCGNTLSCEYYAIKYNNTNSCGCLHKESCSINGKNNKKHGLSKNSSTYQSWLNMRQRCYNKNNDNYIYYGGKGTIVCNRWKDSFENFLEDMGVKPDKNYTIDRIDNKGNYEPSNCKWATVVEQNNNHSKNIKVIDTITNKQYTSINEAARDINMNPATLRDHLKGRIKNKTNLKIVEQ